jgi:hypothetical protein
MMRFLTLLLTLSLSFSALAQDSTPFIPELNRALNELRSGSALQPNAVTSDKIAAGAITGEKIADPALASGIFGAKLASAVINFTDIAAASNTTISLGLPDNAIVLNSLIEVLTTFESATDAATIGLFLETAGDVSATAAISAGGNPWDAGLRLGVPDFATPGDYVKLTQPRDLSVVRAGGEVLTAGRMRVYLWYVVSE